MFKPEDWILSARTLAKLRELFDIAGSASWLLSAVAGLAVMTAILGFFTEHPSIAILLAVMVAYIGFLLFERATLWWRRESLDHKIIATPMPPAISKRPDGSFDVKIQVRLENVADFDISIKIDEEGFTLGDRRAPDATSAMATMVLRPGRPIAIISEAIRGVPHGTNDRAHSSLIIRYGRNSKSLPLRWFFKGDTVVPRELSGDTFADVGTYSINKSDYEWVKS